MNKIDPDDPEEEDEDAAGGEQGQGSAAGTPVKRRGRLQGSSSGATTPQFAGGKTAAVSYHQPHQQAWLQQQQLQQQPYSHGLQHGGDSYMSQSQPTFQSREGMMLDPHTGMLVASSSSRGGHDEGVVYEGQSSQSGGGYGVTESYSGTEVRVTRTKTFLKACCMR
jgi:hypothetical protein